MRAHAREPEAVEGDSQAHDLKLYLSLPYAILTLLPIYICELESRTTSPFLHVRAIKLGGF